MSDNEAFDAMKKQATGLGLQFSPNIGQAKLQERINNALIEKASKPIKPIAAETESEKLMRVRKEAMALVRVKVTCFDPTMKKRSGTYIMGGNSNTGTVRKFIQFGKPWMMPRILVNIMKESQYQGWIEGKTQFGITKMISSMEHRYNIVELPPITTKELEIIKKRQQTTESLEDS